MEIQLQGLYGRHPAARPGTPDALKGLNLQIGGGEHVALIGPSGSGKTTLLQILSAALTPTRGHFLLDQRDPWSLGQHQLQLLRGQLIQAPQMPPLPPRQRVVTAVLAGLLPHQSLLQSLRGLVMPSGSSIALAHHALEQFDVGDKLFERVDRLSGGERQRVALSRLLVSQTRLWLIDEPLSALDPSRARQAMETLTREARDRGVTLIMTLHQVQMALEFFPRVIALRRGELAFDLPAASVAPERLIELYGDQAYELQAPAAAAPEPALPEASAPPAIMVCR